MIEAAKSWRFLEALKRRNGISKVFARGNETTSAGKSKERIDKEDSRDSKEVNCWRCGERGHRRNWCPHREYKEGEKGEKFKRSPGVVGKFDGWHSVWAERACR